MTENTIRAACFTGHRPEKMPFDAENKVYVNMLCSVLYMLANEAALEGCRTFYCGMQRGVDIWAGKAVLSLKRAYPDIRLICVSPYSAEIRGRTGRDRLDYEELKEHCDEFVTLHDTYCKGCFFERNRYMVDRSDYVIAALSDDNSGTAQTVKYAEKRGRKVHLIRLRQFAEDYGIALKE